MAGGILTQPALVLNAHWQPVGVATIARALVKVWRDAARVVDPVDYQLYTWDDWTALRPEQGEPAIRTPRLHIRVPEVVTLRHYDTVPHQVVTFSRRNVFQRDHFTCQYCGRQPGSKHLTIDHVVPRCQGGVSTWENCVLACTACNARKGDHTPEQAGMPLHKRPIQPRWTVLSASPVPRMESWSTFISDAYWNVPLEA
jgi:5-methylcytosine-specific restriction endonuclease McrA